MLVQIYALAISIIIGIMATSAIVVALLYALTPRKTSLPPINAAYKGRR